MRSLPVFVEKESGGPHRQAVGSAYRRAKALLQRVFSSTSTRNLIFWKLIPVKRSAQLVWAAHRVIFPRDRERFFRSRSLFNVNQLDPTDKAVGSA